MTVLSDLVKALPSGAVEVVDPTTPPTRRRSPPSLGTASTTNGSRPR
ncbi:hypothetical protein ABZS66_52995 [Dactylosporangium sp. NPDC005572]